MAGIKDAWGFTKGHTKTTINYSIGAFEALRKTSQIRVTEEQKDRLHIRSGPVQIHVAGTQVTEPLEDEGAPEAQAPGAAGEQKEGQ
jgi:small subunit ribosomal protein S5